MKLAIDRVSETSSQHIFTLTPAWWREASGAFDPDADGLAGDVTVRLGVHRMGSAASSALFFDGEIAGELDLECSRCLARYRQPIRERFRLLLEPAGDRVPADPEGAAALARDGLYLSDELEVGWFRGGEIDLGGFFQEGIALLFPVQPLCREDCRGLCPSCGAERNVTPCNCEAASPSSPFAALRGLRDRMTEGDER